MQDPGFSQIATSIDYFLTLGGRGLIIAFVIASYTRKIRWGYQFDELLAQHEKDEARHKAEIDFSRSECSEYKDLALKLLGHAEQATTTLAKQQG